jgi:hypothetical protein
LPKFEEHGWRANHVSICRGSHHIIQRGNNRQACFFTDDDRRFYLEWLNQAAEKYGAAGATEQKCTLTPFPALSETPMRHHREI